jgi:hypothetical protein
MNHTSNTRFGKKRVYREVDDITVLIVISSGDGWFCGVFGGTEKGRGDWGGSE